MLCDEKLSMAFLLQGKRVNKHCMNRNLKDMDINQLEALMDSIGEPKYRAKQVFMWLSRGASTFDDMSNLPKEMRTKLVDAGCSTGTADILKIQESKSDGTKKYLFGLADGNTIETVFMKYKYGNSLCVSSQVGCRMGCRFCASTIGGLIRSLSPGEMLDQIVSVEKETGEKINHIVVMGIGEPFDNYENLASFIRLANNKDGLNIGMRNITVSTVGLVDVIQHFAEEFPQVNLAISLHAPNDAIREKIMPVNQKYNINTLIEASKAYTERTGRRITFEYALIEGVNDSISMAKELSKLLRGMLCHVNIIPLNKVDGTGLEGAAKSAAVKFKEILESNGITATVRRELGSDIDAACGQLRLAGNGSCSV